MAKKQNDPIMGGAVNAELQKRQQKGIYGLFMMFLGAAIAVAIGAFLYLSPFFNKKPPPPLNQPAEVVPLAQSETKGEFRFYTDLPKQQFQTPPQGMGLKKPESEQSKELKVDSVVKVPPPSVGSSDEVKDETAHTASIELATVNDAYILQVRTFDNPEEANQKRTEVMMAGVDAEVLKRYNDDGSVWYQVISKVMMSKDEAMVAYDKLKSDGIDSVVVKQEY